jgi:MrcB-like, N-terminal domain
MQSRLRRIVELQKSYDPTGTPAMKERGDLIRHELPDEIRSLGPELRRVLGAYGDDADAQGKDNMGQNSRIPWVRWYSRSRSPSATQGWYVVYLFHADASGVSICLSHGSTNLEGSALVQKSDAEVAEFMNWASAVVGKEFAGDATVRRGITLGNFDLARAYERTAVFSKFYPAGRGMPDDEVLRTDLMRFVGLLAKLYRAQELGHEPGASPKVIHRVFERHSVPHGDVRDSLRWDCHRNWFGSTYTLVDRSI